MQEILRWVHISFFLGLVLGFFFGKWIWVVGVITIIILLFCRFFYVEGERRNNALLVLMGWLGGVHSASFLFGGLFGHGIAALGRFIVASGYFTL